ncbi:MAG: hypothetical protein LBF49_01790 [Puniceicoccales bacterium]|jgi:hypothetical protein|nr:hypothetical protein [Puniceicoccales bacterium]
MDTNTRTSSPSQTWANYISFRGLTYLAFGAIRAGVNAVGRTFQKTASIAGRIFFGRGVENVSRKAYDRSVSSVEQSDEEDFASLDFPDGETVDPKVLSANNGESTTEDVPEERSDRGAELLNELKSRNLNSSSSSLVLDLPADASPRAKLNAIMTLQTGRTKDDMDRYLEDVLGLNKENEELSRQIEEESKKIADIKEKASQKECSANKWSAWGQCLITLGGICGTLAQLPLPAIFMAVPQVVAVVGAVGGAAFVVYSSVRKGQAAIETCKSDKMQAETQVKRDKQNKNNTEISTYQNLHSMASQTYNAMFSMWQAMISAENETKRMIASNTR